MKVAAVPSAVTKTVPRYAPWVQVEFSGCPPVSWSRSSYSVPSAAEKVSRESVLLYQRGQVRFEEVCTP